MDRFSQQQNDAPNPSQLKPHTNSPPNNTQSLLSTHKAINQRILETNKQLKLVDPAAIMAFSKDFQLKKLLLRQKGFLLTCSSQLAKERHTLLSLTPKLDSFGPGEFGRFERILSKYKNDILVHQKNLEGFKAKIRSLSSEESFAQSMGSEHYGLLIKGAALRLLAAEYLPKAATKIEKKDLKLCKKEDLKASSQNSTRNAAPKKESNDSALIPSAPGKPRSTRSNTKVADLLKNSSESDPEEANNWSKEDSVQLLRFVKSRGFDWEQCAKDSAFRERHGEPSDCKTQYLRMYKKAKREAMRALLLNKNEKSENEDYSDGSFIVDGNTPSRSKTRRRLRRTRSSKGANDRNASDASSSFESGEATQFSPRTMRKSSRLEAVHKIDYFEENFEPVALTKKENKQVVERILASGEFARSAEFERFSEKLLSFGSLEAFLDDRASSDYFVFGRQGEKEREKGGDSGGEEMFLVKLAWQSYRRSFWFSRAHLEHFFSDSSINSRLNIFLRRKLEIEEQNKELWGPGIHFNPNFLRIERLIARTVAETEKGQTVQYLTLWSGGLSIENATWEREESIPQKEIDQFSSYHSKSSRKTPLEQKRLFVKPTEPRGNEKLLHSYQVEGINWMLANYYQNRNCVLADEMGLGKTLQTLCFLEFLLVNSICSAPFIVVAPLSTVSHWKRESLKWTGLKTLVYYDPKGGSAAREKIRSYEFFFPDGKPKFELLITTYEIASKDTAELAKVGATFLAVDEGHRLKNKQTKLLKALQSLGIGRKLLLSGTPIQNNMIELWTLMHFLQPDRFELTPEIEQNFNKLTNSETIRSLQEKINPHVLRRFKEDVQKSIPPKSETIVDIELTTLQKKYYRAIYEKNIAFLSDGGLKNMPRLMNIEMQLRKCCNHPFLIDGAEDREVPTESSDETYFRKCVEASGKLVFLNKLLPKLKEEGHKVLIFSQMQKVLDILQDYIRHRNYKFERIDGNVVGYERQNAIDRFCADDSAHFIFLLSTRAGGVGLNLAAADTVILYDSDWNPQQDLQAQARCHRIGQEKPVMVYRLVTKNSYESQMFRRASVKLGLDRAFLTKLESDEDGKVPEKDRKFLDEMLRFGAYRFLDNTDTAAKKFCEKDIDELLRTNSRVLSRNSAAKAQTANASAFAKMDFESELADSSLDVNAKDFWEKVLKKDIPKAQRFDEETKRLFGLATSGKAYREENAKKDFWKRVEKHIQNFKKLDGKKAPQMVVNLLVYLQSLSAAFSPARIAEAQKWEAEIDPKGTKRKRSNSKKKRRSTRSKTLKSAEKEPIGGSFVCGDCAKTKAERAPFSEADKSRVCAECKRDCFLCAECGAASAGKFKFVQCVDKKCKRNIHKRCAELVRKRHKAFYRAKSTRNFRCQRHFCLKCLTVDRNLEHCEECSASFHKKCLPRSFSRTGRRGVCKGCRE